MLTVPWAGCVFAVTLSAPSALWSLSPCSTLAPLMVAAGPDGVVPTPSGVLPTAA